MFFFSESSSLHLRRGRKNLFDPLNPQVVDFDRRSFSGLSKTAFVKEVGLASIEEAGRNFTGGHSLTDGFRVAIRSSSRIVSITDIKFWNSEKAA